MSALSNSVSNIIGTKIPYWLWAQLNTRSEKGASEYRNAEVIKYIANKTAWVRMVSSINIKDEDLTHFTKINPDICEADDLAKQYVLFGGTSKYLIKNTYAFRSGFSGPSAAYGMMGKNELYDEVQQFGYRPMPGIVNVNIETQGRLGSVRAATINFKCWDKNQLDVIDALYFKLGYTMFLEWGQTFYFPSEENSQNIATDKAVSTELSSIDPFDPKYVNNKELLYLQIAKNNRETEGNYDAMLGMVTNFNFSFNQEGGYDCMVKLISLGVLGDSIKVNNSSKLVNVLEKKIKIFESITKKLKIAAEAAKKREIEAAVAAELAKRTSLITPTTTGTAEIAATAPLIDTPVSTLVTESIAVGRYNIKGDIAEYKATNYYALKTRKVNQRNRYFPVTSLDGFGSLKLDFFENAIKDTLTTKNNSIGTSLYDAVGDPNSLIHAAPSINVPGSAATPIIAERWFVDLYDKNVWKTYLGKEFPQGPKGQTSPLLVTPDRLQLWYINPSDPKNPHEISFYITSVATDELIPSKDFFFGEGADVTKLRKEVLEQLIAETKIQSINYTLNVPGTNKQTGTTKINKDGRQFTTTVSIRPAGNQNVLPASAGGDLFNENTGDPNYVSVWGEKNRSAIFRNIIGGFITQQTQDAWWRVVEIKKIPNRSIDVIQTGEQAQAVEAGTYVAPILMYTTPRYLITLIGSSVVDLDMEFVFKDLVVEVANEFIGYGGSTADGWVNPVVKIVKKVPVKIFYRIILSELDLIDNFIVEDPKGESTSTLGANPAATATPATAAQSAPPAVKVDNPLSYLSNLELSLRLIQVDSLVNALNSKFRSGAEGLELSQLVVKNYATEDTESINQLFTNGVFSEVIQLLIDGKVEDTALKDPEKSNVKDIFNVYAKYGFATKLLSGQAQVEDLRPVKYKEQLLTSYTLPYNVNQDIETGTSLNHPVYIPFGFFIMLLNHSCTLYNPEAAFPTPLVYVDFNPNHNFCLTTPVHLSVDPLTALIPMEGSVKQYRNLFDPKVLEPDKDVIKAPSSGGSPSALFLPRNSSGKATGKDAYSGRLLQFIDEESIENNENRGRIMNILISVDYLCNVVKRFAKKDGENKVFLKPLMIQVLQDVNKAIGNLNVFRFSYNDAGNVFQILDDQIVPVPANQGKEEQPYLSDYENTTDLPLFGKKSIATNLEIKTEVSSRLSNMLAISANAPEKQAVNSTDATSFGFVNANYTDRYISQRSQFETGSLINYDGEKKAAAGFNLAVTQTYSTDTINENRISEAINYYTDKLANRKSADVATRASAMIPVSLNFTTDGISGIYMGQAFTVDKNFLPYTYAVQKIYGKEDLSYGNKIGFVITGLSHAIEGNTWKTSVKANMIFLKDKSDYGSAKSVSSQGLSATTEVPTPNADKLIQSLTALRSKYDFRVNGKESIAFDADIDDKLSAPALYIIEEVFKKFPTIQLQGITGRSRYHMGLEGNSLHKQGKAVDFSIRATDSVYYVPWQKTLVKNANGDEVGVIEKGHRNYSNYLKVHDFIKQLAGDTTQGPVGRITIKPGSKLSSFGIYLFLDEAIEGSKNATGPHWHFQIY